MRLKVLAATPLLVIAAAAPAATRQFPVRNFDRIESAGAFDVVVHTGGAPRVAAQGMDRALDQLVVEQRGSTLVIRSKPGISFWGINSGRTVVTVSVPGLRAAKLSGSGDLSVDRVRAPAFDLALAGSGDASVGALEVGSLSLSLAGSGDITAAGRARTTSLALRGSGNIHADRLVTQDATVALAGSGDIAIAAQRSVTGSLMGSGDVGVRGPAACTVAKRGSGEIDCSRS